MIIGTTNLVINEIGAVYNVRIEGDTDANLFYTDATNSRIGIGTITPAEKLDVVGKIQVSDNVVIGTSGKGIDFSANTSAAGMTSEVLTWYEEGTFTPAFTTTGTDFTSVGYSQQLGKYTRIGNCVYIVVQLSVNALTAGSPTGDLVVSGYPFTINASYTPVLSIGLAGAYTVNIPSMAQARANNTMSRLYYRTLANGGFTVMSPTELTSTTTIVLSGFYFV
jgi:hypothetical protein